MSAGGRPSNYYSITTDGEKELHNLLLSPIQENPVQVLTTTRIRLSCAKILSPEERKELYKILKNKITSIMLDTKKMLETTNSNFYSEMVLDNLLCECKNLLSLLEGFERASNN